MMQTIVKLTNVSRRSSKRTERMGRLRSPHFVDITMVSAKLRYGRQQVCDRDAAHSRNGLFGPFDLGGTGAVPSLAIARSQRLLGFRGRVYIGHRLYLASFQIAEKAALKEPPFLLLCDFSGAGDCALQGRLKRSF